MSLLLSIDPVLSNHFSDPVHVFRYVLINAVTFAGEEADRTGVALQVPAVIG